MSFYERAHSGKIGASSERTKKQRSSKSSSGSSSSRSSSSSKPKTSKEKFEQEFREEHMGSGGAIKTSSRTGHTEYYVDGKLQAEYNEEGNKVLTQGSYTDSRTGQTKSVSSGRSSAEQASVTRQRDIDEAKRERNEQVEEYNKEVELQQRGMNSPFRTGSLPKSVDQSLLNTEKYKIMDEGFEDVEKQQSVYAPQADKEAMLLTQSNIQATNQIQQEQRDSLDKPNMVQATSKENVLKSSILDSGRLQNIKRRQELRQPSSFGGALGKTGTIAVISTAQFLKGGARGILTELPAVASPYLSATGLNWYNPVTSSVSSFIMTPSKRFDVVPALQQQFSSSPEQFVGEFAGGISGFSSALKTGYRSVKLARATTRLNKIERRIYGNTVNPDTVRQLQKIESNLNKDLVEFGGAPSLEIRGRPLEQLRVASESYGTGSVLGQRRVISPEFGQEQFYKISDLQDSTGLFEFTSRKGVFMDNVPLSSKSPVVRQKNPYYVEMNTGVATVDEIPTRTTFETRITSDIDVQNPQLLERQVGSITFRELDFPSVSKTNVNRKQIPFSPLKINAPGIEYKGGISFKNTKQLGFVPESQLSTITVQQGGRARRFIVDPRNNFIVKEMAVGVQQRKPVKLTSLAFNADKPRKNVKTVSDILGKPTKGESVTSGGGIQQILKNPRVINIRAKQDKKTKTKTKKKTRTQQEQFKIFGIATTQGRQQYFSGFQYATAKKPIFTFKYGGKTQAQTQTLSKALKKAQNKKLFLKGTLDTKTKTLTDTLTRKKSLTDTISDTLKKSKTLTKAKTLAKTLSMTKTDTLTKSDLLKIPTKIKPVRKKPTSTKRSTSILPKLPRGSQQSDKRVAGYHSYVFKDRKKTRISRTPRPKQQALNRLLTHIDTTPRASGFVEKTGQKVSAGTTSSLDKKFKKKFRTRTTKKGKKRYIEKRKHRIDSAGEVLGISVKGMNTRKNKGFKLF